jgi:glycine oxidase
MRQTEICIAGAGIVGLSLALELSARGRCVTVIEAGVPMAEASTAAAGMLAANDPHNPAKLSALSHLSVALYPEFLDRIQALSGIAVPFQTSHTLQFISEPGVAPLDARLMTSSDGIAPPSSSGYLLLDERSVDPRQLAAALIAAVSAAGIDLVTGNRVVSTQSTGGSITVRTTADEIEAAHFVDCTGAWAAESATVFPVKGQMLSVALPRELAMCVTVRTKQIYIVPRTTGPNAGRAIIGATVEDAGFDRSVDAAQIEALRHHAVRLIPELAAAAVLESWSGLRPGTADGLPLIGPHPEKPRMWTAAGHFRNGILLAPATARVMAQMLCGETPSVDLQCVAPARLTMAMSGARAPA